MRVVITYDLIGDNHDGRGPLLLTSFDEATLPSDPTPPALRAKWKELWLVRHRHTESRKVIGRWRDSKPITPRKRTV